MSNNLILPTLQVSVRASETGALTALAEKDNRWQIFNLSGAANIALPSAGIKAGEVIRIENRGAFKLTINASNTSELTVANGCNNTASIQRGNCNLIALQDTPTTPAHWMVSDLSESGVYTPTLSNIGNVGASTAAPCMFMRVNKIVQVSGTCDVDPTTASTTTDLRISLPVASDLAANGDCMGVAVGIDTTPDSAIIRPDTAGNAADLRIATAADVANRTWVFQFMYQML